MRPLSFLTALFAASAALAQRPAATQKPTLVVLIAVDQMRADYLERFDKQLTGGLARLDHGGAVFTNAYQDHAITETAPGHSVMLAGRFPRSTGIVTNSEGVNGTPYPVINYNSQDAAPIRFRGTTLVDWLHSADPRSRALSVSRKDRAAILPIGKSKSMVFWYEPNGQFTTSTYYADALPDWVVKFNDEKIPQTYAGKKWDLLLPASEYPEPDSVPLENAGRNYVFPHYFPADPQIAAASLIAFPAMDSLTAQFALRGVTGTDLGQGPQTDVLSVSFSTTDAVGHGYGPDSRELHDQILRLDRYLGQFIDSLYKIRDSSKIVFALTADHGVGPYPELYAAREHKQPERVDVSPIFSRLQGTLRAAGLPPDALTFEDFVSADRKALAAAHFNPDSLLRALADSIKHVKGVERVDWVKDLAKDDTVKDYVARRWYHMLPPDLPAEFTVTIDPYAYYKQTPNATHGTPHDYDAHVPVIFYGPPFKTGKYSAPALVEDIAPTFAEVAGVKPAERLDGRVRRDALKP